MEQKMIEQIFYNDVPRLLRLMEEISQSLKVIAQIAELDYNKKNDGTYHV
jgi:predicted secreted protein